MPWMDGWLGGWMDGVCRRMDGWAGVALACRVTDGGLSGADGQRAGWLCRGLARTCWYMQGLRARAGAQCADAGP
eukprot:scaffold1931_cov390-Prasinococcus_capsulatus_cf.AAC.7